MHKCNLHSWMMTLCCVGLFCNSSETFAGPHLESELAKHWPGVSIYNYGLQDSGEYRQRYLLQNGKPLHHNMISSKNTFLTLNMLEMRA
jgi:hypothetical protein